MFLVEQYSNVSLDDLQLSRLPRFYKLGCRNFCCLSTSTLSTFQFFGREKPQFTHWLSTVVVVLRGNKPRKLYEVVVSANVDFSQAVGSGDNDRLTPSPTWGSRHGRPPESYSWKIVSLPHFQKYFIICSWGLVSCISQT